MDANQQLKVKCKHILIFIYRHFVEIITYEFIIYSEILEFNCLDIG
jgi:hypothetical protein